MDFRRDTITRFITDHARSLMLILSLALAGVIVCSVIIPPENQAVAQQLIGFPDSDAFAQKARPWILAGLCLLPAIAALCYSLSGTLDRYITRRFLLMFSICLSALYVIWVLMDVSDNISEFRRSDDTAKTVMVYYATRLPAVLLLLLPYALLLSLLESLGKLSNSREVIAVIQSGRGVFRMTAPLIIGGLFCTLFTLGINYHWAPVAEGRQQEILDQAIGKAPSEATKVLYQSRETRRLWMVHEFPPKYEQGRALVDVEVTTTDEDGNLVSRLYAKYARWDRDTRAWTFHEAIICRFRNQQPPLFETYQEPLIIDSWQETPWQIIKPGLPAEHLGIPGLNAWLRTHEQHPQMADPSPYLTHWHYRWALPFTCLITVLLATPLAIHFSRRGTGGGVFLAVALSALMMVFNTIILAFGESGNLPPMLAAWLPNIVFALTGIYLYRRRISGRPIYQSFRKVLPPVGEA